MLHSVGVNLELLDMTADGKNEVADDVDNTPLSHMDWNS